MDTEKKNAMSGETICYLILLVFFLIFLTFGCSVFSDIKTQVKKNDAIALQSANAGVIAFLTRNPALGKYKSTKAMPDWASGTREQITTTEGNYLVYLQGDEVLTVLQYSDKGFPNIEIYRKK